MRLLRKLTRRNLRKLPRKLSELGLQAAYRLRLSRVPFLPQAIDLEPNNYCNLRCPHCQVTHWSKPATRLTEESFCRIADQFPHLRIVKLQGMGEPLLNRHFLDMLRAGERREMNLRFTTNGMLCDEKTAEQLATLTNTRIIFSMDGATPEVFESIRVGSDFEKIRSNISRLIEARGNRKQPEICFWTVVTKMNEHQLRDILLLAKELCVDQVTFQTFLSNWGKQDFDSQVDPMRVSSDVMADAEQFASEQGVELRVCTDNFLTKDKPCYWPWRSTYIAANGDVIPCCVVADSDVVKMGNVFEQDFKTIWNSREYRNLRRMIRKHKLPRYCRACYGRSESAVERYLPGQ